jgi:hypothetical protein
MSEQARKRKARDRATWPGVAVHYLDALDAGDLETVARLWERAAADPELERILGELTDGLALEEGPDPHWKVDVGRIKDLLRQYLPSARGPAAPQGPLTVADIAARLQADSTLGGRLSAADQASNARLLGNSTPIPGELGLAHFEKWQQTLGISASAQYWRAFRQAAVLLSMGRCQQVGELAAARQAGTAAAQQAGRAPRGGRS